MDEKRRRSGTIPMPRDTLAMFEAAAAEPLASAWYEVDDVDDLSALGMRVVTV